MPFSASKSSLKTRAGWLRSSRGCCWLNVLTHKKDGCPLYRAAASPDPGCWVLPCLWDPMATATREEEEAAATARNPIGLPPPRCPNSRGSLSQRDAKPLGCTPKFGLAGCTKDRLLWGLAGQRLPLSSEHGHTEPF